MNGQAGPFQNLLLVVDGTECSVKAAEAALAYARAFPVKLTAVTVVDTATLGNLLTARILVQAEMGEFEAELERSQRRHLDYVASLARKANIAVETVLRKGVFHSAILMEQRQRKSDLIVLGGFKSTITKIDLPNRERQIILEQAPCPVLVVK